MNQFKSLFGAPENVKFCSKCVISNQRPNSETEYKHSINTIKKYISFNSENICSACELNEKKKNVDWKAREDELHKLSDLYKNFPGKYNCIVPGSGGKDSFYQSFLLKHKYNFRPLTITWAPTIYTDWGWANFQNWIHSGFDNILISPNGKIHRLLTRLAVENIFHPFQPFILGQKNLAPKMAKLFQIPLIFYGENEAEYGNPIADFDKSQRDSIYFATNDYKNIYLGGTSLETLTDVLKIELRELDLYLPENHNDFKKSEITVHYLGYYEKWHPQSAYYFASENSNFMPSPERTPGTYSKYNSIDDKIDDLHYWTTYIKFGIGRATYDAAQEIRNGDILRNEGVSLVKKFDGEWPNRFEDELMKYMTIDDTFSVDIQNYFNDKEMTKQKFFNLADKFRSEHLWHNVNGLWELRNEIK